MMNKEDFHENQLVVRVDREERGETFFTVVEVHNSHIVIMHPRYGLDAVFFDQDRRVYSPATRKEITTKQIEIMDKIAETRKEEQQLIGEAKKLQGAVAKLDETNR